MPSQNMEKDKKIKYYFPEFRIGSSTSEKKSDEKSRNLHRVNVLCGFIGWCFYEQLYNSTFQLPNTQVLGFSIDAYSRNEYYSLGKKDRIGSAHMVLDYPYFTQLSNEDKRIFLLKKIEYAFLKLADMADVDATELLKASEYIQQSNFKIMIDYKAKTSRNRRYRAGKMFVPYFGCRDWYIWVKDLQSEQYEEVFLFREATFFITDHPEIKSVLDSIEFISNREVIHGWNKNTEFEISWKELHYFYNPETKILRQEIIKL